MRKMLIFVKKEIQFTNIFYSLVIVLIMLSASCNDKTANDKKTQETAKIEFYHTEFDFGTVKMGEKLVHDFMFKNTGKGDLFIKEIKTDCGCTAAKYKNEAIKAGEESSIEAVFSSEGFPGFQTKTITVFTNAGDSTILTLAAVVEFELIEN